ncbi:MAG: 5-(carboxyamino)imidazole ribonucleotide synthase [Cyanobacteria bacterium M_surface_9_m1_291]|nr:5-(carboxyamino)imidazole ribonucleotide synthase [Cyanobacteria bacterium M_surface_9_m1_291]
MLDSIGIVGGGQLALMLAEEAPALGVALHVQTPNANDPAAPLASSLELAALDDLQATRRLSRRCAAISFENEWLDLAALEELAAEGVQFVPELSCLEQLVSKRRQRELLNRLDLPAPRWCGLEAVLQPRRSKCDGSSESERRSDEGERDEPSAPVPQLPEGLAFPVMAKAATGGYDGKGTRVLHQKADLEALLAAVDPHDWILEELVAFELELAQLACRDRQGRVQCYPLVQTHQHQHVCDWVLAPAPVPHAVQAQARNLAASLLTAIGYVGMVSLELFYGRAGLQVNEIAPRTHNAGHFSIEACHTSQFAQHLRIVAGLPMGDAALKLPGALMVNLLGFDAAAFDDGTGATTGDYLGQRQALADLPGAALHWYGKQGGGLGRKLGHLTLTLESPDPQARVAEAMQKLEQVRQIWPLPQAR